MRMFGWVRKQKPEEKRQADTVCQDIRTRLDCKELHAYQHDVGNANSGIGKEWKAMLKIIPGLHDAIQDGRQDLAAALLNELNAAFLAMHPHIKRIDEVLKGAIQ